MSSQRQIAANRLNAQRSTGPRGPAGKAKASVNAMKHGFTARAVVLPDEDPEEFESFRAELLGSLHPKGPLENEHAEIIVVTLWRRRRCPRFEALLYKHGFAKLRVSQAQELVTRYESTAKHRALAELEKKTVAERDRQAHEDASQKLACEQAQLEELAFDVPRVLETFPEPFRNLWRHESSLTRSFLRHMHELERLQARSAGQHVPAPEVVDVNVSVGEPTVGDVPGHGNGETHRNQKLAGGQ